MTEPSYIYLYRKGKLKERISLLNEFLSKCELCPHKCGVNRLKGNLGLCRAGINPRIFSYQFHLGEEPAISGVSGSGTIFFSHCTGRCIYCQNWHFSRLGEGKEVTAEGLSDIMMELQKGGCHNINLVTPTHYIAQILAALEIAIGRGLNIPIVYNTSGYERIEVLKLLEGIIDIYLPDMRYGNNGPAEKYSGFKNYVEINRMSIKEMYRQVGNVKLENDIAVRGLIIRHLILPHNLSGTPEVMQFIKEEISQECFISLMSQYYPFYQADNTPLLDRPITREEYENACKVMLDLGLENGWIQEEMDEKTRRDFAGVYFKPLNTN